MEFFLENRSPLELLLITDRLNVLIKFVIESLFRHRYHLSSMFRVYIESHGYFLL